MRKAVAGKESLVLVGLSHRWSLVVANRCAWVQRLLLFLEGHCSSAGQVAL